MAYKLISVKCPDCGQTLPIEENRTQAFCTYCGAKVLISNENEQVVRHIDEADIKKAETDRIVRLRELEITKKKSSHQKLLTALWIILSLALLTLAVLIMLSPSTETKDSWADGFLFFGLFCIPVIWVSGYLVLKWLPEREERKEEEKRLKEEENQMIKQGGIRLPLGIGNYSEKKYFVIRDLFSNAGFTNISCINLHDLNIFSALANSDKIENITVDGKWLYSKTIYLPDTPIVITYHGK